MIVRSLRFSLLLPLVGLALLVGTGSRLEAQPLREGIAGQNDGEQVAPFSDRSQPNELLSFRRYFIPESRQAEVAGGYLPLRREKFEELLAEIRQKRVAQQSAVHLTSARYFAVLENSTLRGGFAHLDFHNPASIPLPSLLQPLGLAVGSPVWELPNRSPAQFGTDSEGRTWVVVPQSGRLILPWSLHGESDDQGASSFRLRLPSCPSNQLVLALPRNMVPVAEEGLVSQWRGDPGDPRGGPESEEFAQADLALNNFWQIDLGGNSETTLKLAPGSRDEPLQPYVAVRQADQYTCYSSRVELHSELTLDIYRASTEGLVVRLDETFALVDARLGDESISWTVEDEPYESQRRYQLQFPRALQGPQHSLRLTVHAPLLVDQPWRLPHIECEQVFWQEGRAELIFPDGLELENLVSQACVQTKVNTLPQGVTSLSFQCYRPDYSLDVTWRHREARLTGATGTAIRMDAELISGEFVADLQAKGGEVFLVQARVPKPWELDRVDVEPSSALASASGAWRLEDGLLEIPLREPITADRGVRIRIEGHRVAPPEASGLRVEQLEFLQLNDMPRGSSLMRVHANLPLQVKLVDDVDLPRVDPRGLSPDDLQRLGDGTDGVYFRREEAPATLTALVVQDTPSFVADIRVEATLDSPHLTEAYVIRCTPESLPVRRLRVQLSQARAAPLVWRLSGYDEPLTANLLSDSNRLRRGESGGEIWEVELPRPQSSVFEIQGERSLEMETATSISLASVPDAVSESGRVSVRSHDSLQLTPFGLEPLPRQPTPPDQYPQLRGTFRYQPSHTDQLLVDWDHASPAARAWVWGVQYNSHVVGDHQVVHDALFRLQNTGADMVECEIPVGVQSLVVHVDQRPVPEIIERGRLLIPLPASRRFPVVHFRYRTVAQGTVGGLRLTVPFPRLNLPTLTARWNIATAADDHVASRISGRKVLSHPAAPPRVRLLGPFAGSTQPRRAWPPSSRAGTAESPQPVPAGTRQSVGREISWWGNVSQAGTEFDGLWTTPVELLGISQPVSWRELFSLVDRLLVAAGPQDAPRRLLVDQYALAMAGIRADALVPRLTGTFPDQLALGDLWSRQELRILVAGDLLLMTTDQMVSLYAGELVRPAMIDAERRPALVRQDSWLYHLLHDSESGASGFPPATGWPSHPETPAISWDYGELPHTVRTPARRGWTLHTLQLDPNRLEPAELLVTRSMFRQKGGWIVFLTTAAVGAWFGRRASRWMAFYVSIAAAVALLVPESHLTWGAGSFWGALLAWCYVAIRPEVSPSGIAVRDAGSRRQRFAWGTAAIVVCWLAYPATAQDQRSSEPLVSGDEFSVLIPIDRERQPVGSYVYVPRQFYDLIYRYLAADTEPFDWLIRKASYSASYGSATTSDRSAISTLTAVYQVETYQGHQWIHLPFKRRELQLIDVKLNGQAAEVRWSSSEDELMVMATQPRLHELSLVLAVRRSELGSVLNIAVPSVPQATLAVRDLPPSIRLESVGALGAHRTRDGRLEVDLGPVSRITLRQADMRGRADSAVVEVEELAWLRVRPGATVLDVRLHVSVQSGHLDSLSLLADSRLRLLPISGGQPVDGEPVITDGDYQQIRLKLRETAGPRFQLQLSFLLSNSSGIGQMRMPRWECLGAGRSRRLLAVSHAPILQFHNVRHPTLRPVTTAAFLEAWGRDTEIPQAGYELPAEEPASDQDWHAESRFLPSETTVNQQTRVRVAQDVVELSLDAILSTTGSPAFQRRLQVPPDLEIDEVLVIEGDTEQAPQYRLSGSGELTVFLSAPAETRQRLLVQGRVPLRQRLLDFPLMRVLDGDTEADLVEVYRDAGVEKVTLQHIDAWTAQTSVDPGGGSSTEDHWIGTWSRPVTEPGAQQPTLAIQPNQRKAEGFLATRLLRSSEGWRVEAEYHVQVRQGVFDMIRLELPSDWLPPIELDPPHPFELRPLPGENRQQLLIRPQEPVTDHASVRIRGSLSATGDRIRRVPDLLPLDVTRAQRFLVVPTRLEAQQISWATSGLQARALPDLFGLAREQTDAWESYQILGTRFHATIQHVERVAGFAQVRLADIHVAWQNTGYHGVAAFDLEPAGRPSCLVSAPPGVELLAATLDGTSAGLEVLDANRWRVFLGPRQLPQRLELIFRGRAERLGHGETTIRVPFCEDLPVARTLWTVRSPARQNVAWDDRFDSRVGSLRQEIVRLESLVALVDLSLDAAAELGTEDTENWVRTWAARIAAARASIGALRMSQPYSEVSGLDERLQAIEDAWRADSRRVGSTSVAVLFSEQFRENQGLAPAWDRATRGLHYDLKFMFPGTADSLTLQVGRPEIGLLFRVVWGGLLLAGGLAVALARRPIRLWEWGREYPHLLLMLIGVLAFLWIVPGWIGAGIIAISILSAWRRL